RLVFAAELGAQPSHVHVDGAGAAEEVVTPDLLEQLGAGEHPARVLGEVLEQLELLVGEVERAAAQPGGVGALVDDELTQGDLAGVLRAGDAAAAADQQAQPRVQLGGDGTGQEDVVEAPV